jgi:hypothetical protein
VTGDGGDIGGFAERRLNRLKVTREIMAEQGFEWVKAADQLRVEAAVVGEGAGAFRAPRLHLREKRGDGAGGGEGRLQEMLAFSREELAASGEEENWELCLLANLTELTPQNILTQPVWRTVREDRCALLSGMEASD